MGKITYGEIEELKDIKHSLLKELIEYGKKDGKLNEIDTLAHTIKNMCKIIEDGEMELEKEEGYSGRRGRSGAQGGNSGAYMMSPGYSMAGYSMAPMMMPEYAWAEGGNYGAQGGSSGARGGGGGGRSGRYSSHGNLASELYSIMGTVQDERERQELQNLINRLEQ